MAKKSKKNRVQITLRSEGSNFTIYKYIKKVPGKKFECMKFNPKLRKHVLFKEVKLKK